MFINENVRLCKSSQKCFLGNLAWHRNDKQNSGVGKHMSLGKMKLNKFFKNENQEALERHNNDNN